MRFDVLTLFPEMFNSFLQESLIGKALEKRAFEIKVVDIRDFTTDRHRTVDDRPFGGGPGMVLKPEPVVLAVESAHRSLAAAGRRTIMLSPSGRTLTQEKVRELAGLDHLVLVCGRYEGIDERVACVIDEHLSIGDYVLSGGEVPAMVVVEAVARLLPGVLGKAESTREESFTDGLLEYPHYTRPRIFNGREVPETLLSGDHGAIRKWRLKESLKRTLKRRPDLLQTADLGLEGQKILAELQQDSASPDTD
jgi:tRNA (guanine37-N1)-methyltransferase